MHDVVNHRMFTPESAAARAGNEEIVALLANWPIARLKYFDSEFVHEWMHFLCDPDANLEQNLTAKEVVGLVRMEAHEENTAVRARGGHTLIDEIVTGPIVSAKDRSQALLTEFLADAVSITSTLESSNARTNNTTPRGVIGGVEDEVWSTLYKQPGTVNIRFVRFRVAMPRQSKKSRCAGYSHSKKENGPFFSACCRSRVQLATMSSQNIDATYTNRYSTLFSDRTKSNKAHGGDNGDSDNAGEGGNNVSARQTKSRLGGEIDVFLSQARDENGGALGGAAGGGEVTAYSRLLVKANLEGRKNRWPGRRNNGGKGSGVGTATDPFGRPMTTSQRRRVAALEVAEDGGDFL